MTTLVFPDRRTQEEHIIELGVERCPECRNQALLVLINGVPVDGYVLLPDNHLGFTAHGKEYVFQTTFNELRKFVGLMTAEEFCNL